MPGRKAKPTKLKMLQGNPGRRPINKNEPQPESGVPECPSHLPTRAKAVWKELVPQLDAMGVLTKIDRRALELLVDAYAEYRKAREVIQKEGYSYSSETKDGGIMIRPRPEVTVSNDAWRRVRLMMTEFGLTPASRAKLSTQPKESVDPMEELLNRRA